MEYGFLNYIKDYYEESPGELMDAFNKHRGVLIEFIELLTSKKVGYAEVCEINIFESSFSIYVEGKDFEESAIIRIVMPEEKKEELMS